jgi:hypothetical protein
VRRHSADGHSWLFAFNHSDDSVALPGTGLELLSGSEVTGTFDVAPQGVAVVREDGSFRLCGNLRGLCGAPDLPSSPKLPC